MVVAPALGSLCFGSIFSLVYDSNTDTEDRDSGGAAAEEHRCYDTKCFSISFLLTGTLNLLVVAVALILLKKSEYLRRRFQVPPLLAADPSALQTSKRGSVSSISEETEYTDSRSEEETMRDANPIDPESSLRLVGKEEEDESGLGKKIN